MVTRRGRSCGGEQTYELRAGPRREQDYINTRTRTLTHATHNTHGVTGRDSVAKEEKTRERAWMEGGERRAGGAWWDVKSS